MRIQLHMKKIAKIKDCLTYQSYETNAETVKDFILEMVACNVAKYNKKRDAEQLFLVSDIALQDMSAGGKVEFGDIKNKRKIDTRIMQDEALFQFQNGRFKIINETKKLEYKAMNERLEFCDGDSLVIIKLSLLSGRVF